MAEKKEHLMSDYREPLPQLMTLGRPDSFEAANWINYVHEYNLTDEHIPDLIRMLETYTQPLPPDAPFDAESPEIWTGIHAWRALGQLKAEAAVQPIIDAIVRHVWEEWDYEDVPQALAMIGEAAIDGLEKALLEQASDTEANPFILQNALEVIGKNYADYRERIVDIFISMLENAENNLKDLNGFVMCSLKDWQIERALPAIEKAFEGDYIDWTICGDWDEVQVDFGLKDPETIDADVKNALRRAEMLRQMGMDTVDLGDLPSSGGSSPKANKAKKKKRKIAQKSRKQNRKKKK
jgi:hypothetical protein